MTRPERWWHVYIGVSEVGTVTIIGGESTVHPEQLVADPTRLVIELPDSNWFGAAALRYVRSYNRKPSDAEIDALGEAIEQHPAGGTDDPDR